MGLNVNYPGFFLGGIADRQDKIRELDQKDTLIGNEEADKQREVFLQTIKDSADQLKELAAGATTPQQKQLVQNLAENLKAHFTGPKGQALGLDNYASRAIDLAVNTPDALQSAQTQAQVTNLDPKFKEEKRKDTLQYDPMSIYGGGPSPGDSIPPVVTANAANPLSGENYMPGAVTPANPPKPGDLNPTGTANASTGIDIAPGLSLAPLPNQGPVRHEEVLQNLPSGVAQMVRNMVDGKSQPFTGYAKTKPQAMQLMALANEYEPGFDEATWGQRYKTITDFANSKGAGGNVTALNTVMQHLDKLDKSIAALGNVGGFPGAVQMNTVKNMYKKSNGDPAITNFETNKTAVIDELTRVFRGTAGNQADIDQWKKTIDAAHSPQQLHGAIQSAIGLIDGRMNALADQFRRGTGHGIDPASLLSPTSRAVYDRLSGTQTPAENPSDVLQAARDAIAAGAPKAKVIERLKNMNIDPGAL